MLKGCFAAKHYLPGDRFKGKRIILRRSLEMKFGTLRQDVRHDSILSHFIYSVPG